ncbi:MAG: methionyl-tRNA formyltransferase [Candidatus Comchoanobacterales bacterium]
MKVIFAGTSLFACPTLEALLNSEHDVLAVLTQPDRPAGRGLRTQESPVKKIAKRERVQLHQPVVLDDVMMDVLESYQADVMIIVAYGLKIPPRLLAMFPLGCLNIHPSKLPQYRGAAPIHAAIVNGDKETAVCVMQMDEGWDSGPIVAQSPLDIGPQETTHELLGRASDMGATMLLDVLNMDVPWPLHHQSGEVSFAKKTIKSQLKVDWTESAAMIERKVRAYGHEGLYSVMNGVRVKIHQVCLSDINSTGQVGQIQNSIVSCGDKSLKLVSWTLAGKKRVSPGEMVVLNGFFDKQ